MSYLRCLCNNVETRMRHSISHRESRGMRESSPCANRSLTGFLTHTSSETIKIGQSFVTRNRRTLSCAGSEGDTGVVENPMWAALLFSYSPLSKPEHLSLTTFTLGGNSLLGDRLIVSGHPTRPLEPTRTRLHDYPVQSNAVQAIPLVPRPSDTPVLQEVCLNHPE